MAQLRRHGRVKGDLMRHFATGTPAEVSRIITKVIEEGLEKTRALKRGMMQELLTGRLV